MLINMKDLTKVAYENKFAVGAFNIGNYEILKIVMDTAEKLDSPVILEIHPDELNYFTDNFVEAVKSYAINSKVPVVVHLDHGANIDQIVRAIKCGFTSVMIDGSSLAFEDNVAITKKAVELAHSVNVSVEGEIGSIGVNDNSFEGGSGGVIYTDVNQAEDFVKRTNIDTLAVAIGTAHGLYPKGMVPKLNLDLLKEINDRIKIPLVLHGGSGNPDNEIAQSVTMGVSKVNISSDMKSVFFAKVKEIIGDEKSIEPNSVFKYPIEEAEKVVEHKMKLFNSVGKASLYK